MILPFYALVQDCASRLELIKVNDYNRVAELNFTVAGEGSD